MCMYITHVHKQFSSLTLCKTLSVLHSLLSGLLSELAMLVTAVWMASASVRWRALLPTITIGDLAEASSLEKGCLPVAMS